MEKKWRRICLRIIAAIGVLMLLMLAGDSKKNLENREMKEASSVLKNKGEKGTEGEIATVIMTFQTIQGSRMEDFGEVVEAINAITVPEIGVRVEMKVVESLESYTQYPLWLSKGEQVDLMVMNYQDITAYISKGMLRPIDVLLKAEAPDICCILEEKNLTEGSVADGRIYGVASLTDCFGGSGGIWVPKRLFEETGLSFQENHIYSMEEIESCLAAWRGIYPESYPLGQITSGGTATTYGYYREMADSLGGDIVTGMVEEKSGRIVNFYASQEYYDFLQYMRRWYLVGYLYPDNAITDADISELVQAGKVLSYPLSSTPGLNPEKEFGEELVCMRTGVVKDSRQGGKSGFWTIPATSKNPRAAIRFLNMMFGDTRIINLLRWGIEGKHYIVIDEENGRIAYPDGVDSTNAGYFNPLGMYGNLRDGYTMDSPEIIQKKEEYTKEAVRNRKESRYNGFVYSPAKMDREIAAAEKVVEKYVPYLESGSIDLDIYYPQFLKELESAGISRIIADKQEQLDAWLLKQEDGQ